MGRFTAGLLVGLLAGGAGATIWWKMRSPADSAAAAKPDAGVLASAAGKGKTKGKRGGHRGGGAHGGAGGAGGGGGSSGGTGSADGVGGGDNGMDGVADEPAIVLAPGDEVEQTDGDVLKVGPRNMNLGDGKESRDLTQGEIDAGIAKRASAITHCIETSRGAAPVNGRITLGFVVGADGGVLRTRIEAPAYLLHHGLGACARHEAAALRFPAIGQEQVVTVPFDVKG